MDVADFDFVFFFARFFRPVFPFFNMPGPNGMAFLAGGLASFLAGVLLLFFNMLRPKEGVCGRGGNTCGLITFFVVAG